MKAFLIATTAMATASAAFALDDRMLLVGQTIMPVPSLTEFQADAATQAMADAEADADADALAESRAEMEAAAAADLRAEAELEAEALSRQQMQAQAEATANLQSDAAIDAEALSEFQAETRAEAAADLEADAALEAGFLSDLQAEAQAGAATNLQADAVMEGRADSGMNAGAADRFFATRWDEADLGRATYTDSHEWIEAGVHSSDGIALGEVDRVRLNKNGEADAIVVSHGSLLETDGHDTLIERFHFTPEATADGQLLVLGVIAAEFEPSTAFLVEGSAADCLVNPVGRTGGADAGDDWPDMK